MKKRYIAGLMLIVFMAGTVFYQQHQLIKDYRGLLHGQLFIIQKPIERILIFQETAEQYNDEQRTQLMEQLYNSFSDVASYTGGGLQMEPHIKEQFFGDYLDTKTKYAHSLTDYINAETVAEREAAHSRLKEQYEAYEEFLKKAEKELVESFE